MYHEIIHAANQISDDLTAWRRHIHQFPELKMETPKTE